MSKSLARWKRYGLIYGVLLALSHLTIWALQEPISLDGERPDHQIPLRAVAEDGNLTNRMVSISYDTFGDSLSRPVLVLLPGGPEGPDVFDRLIPKLKDRYHIIVPHLPGYGTPQDELPNYSFNALAAYVQQLVDKLNIHRVHVLGYGLGGASAIYWAHDDPQKIESVILLSSIGVQELELLGSYTLNHAIHGLQLALVWVLHNVIPHFGLFDALGVGMPYAKSYYESDQRPIRSYLKAYRKPMLILHGTKDALVPEAVAREHHRIVPQSELMLYQADHDLVETHTDSLERAIESFTARVESGQARIYTEASPQRLAEAQKPFSNVDFAKFKGVSLLILMFIIILATLISEDLTCIGAGLLAARGLIGFWPATLACLLGIFIGDVGLYLMGRFVGRSAIRRAPFKWFISENDLDKSAEWFKRKGPMIIIASRFLPGSRFPTYFSAGVIGAGFWMFISYFLLAAIIWTPILVGISQLLGNELLRYFSVYKEYALWVFLGLIIFLVMIAKFIIPAFSYRGRRLLVSRYRRFTRWQYWSPFLIYLPVAYYIFYLGIRHRCFTLFALANPGIPYGGFAGESKSGILSAFEGRHVGPYLLLPAAWKSTRQIARAHNFMREQKLSFPVVLKPDIGQRGADVRIVRNDEELASYLQEAFGDVIIQEYIKGKEYGIFYYRLPDEKEGSILSITGKTLPHVEGDGERTIEELILADDRTVTLAKYHLKKHEHHLYEVPARGQQIPVVERGSHAKGAVFKDSNNLQTQQLTDAVNTICTSATGFCFGRLDVKVPTTEDFKNGENLKIVEVNGVTSESTVIYDDQYNVFEGIKKLCRQWRIAFEIGAENRAQGMTPPGIWDFLRRTFKALLEQYKRK